MKLSEASEERILRAQSKIDDKLLGLQNVDINQLFYVVNDILDCVHPTSEENSSAYDALRYEIYSILYISKADFYQATRRAAEIFITIEDLIKEQFFYSTDNHTSLFSNVSKTGVSFYEMAARALQYEGEVECYQLATAVCETILKTLLTETVFKQHAFDIDTEVYSSFKMVLSSALEKYLVAIRKFPHQSELVERLAADLGQSFFKKDTSIWDFIFSGRKPTITFQKPNANDSVEAHVNNLLIDSLDRAYSMSEEEKELLKLYRGNADISPELKRQWEETRNNTELHRSCFSRRDPLRIELINKNLLLYYVPAIAVKKQFTNLLRYLMDIETTSVALDDPIILYELFRDIPYDPEKPETLSGKAEELRSILVLSRPDKAHLIARHAFSSLSAPLKKALFPALFAALQKKGLRVHRSVLDNSVNDTAENVCLSALKANDTITFLRFLPILYFDGWLLENLCIWQNAARKDKDENTASHLNQLRAYITSPAWEIARATFSLLLSDKVTLEKASILAHNAATYLSTFGITKKDLPSRYDFYQNVKNLYPLIRTSKVKNLHNIETDIILPDEIMVPIVSPLVEGLNGPLAKQVVYWSIKQLQPGNPLTLENFFSYLSDMAKAASAEQTQQQEKPKKPTTSNNNAKTSDKPVAKEKVTEWFAELYGFAGARRSDNNLSVALHHFLTTTASTEDFDTKRKALLKEMRSAQPTIPISKEIALYMLKNWLQSNGCQSWFSGKHVAEAVGLWSETLLEPTEKAILSSLPTTIQAFETYEKDSDITHCLKEVLTAFKTGEKSVIEKSILALSEAESAQTGPSSDASRYKQLEKLAELLRSPNVNNVITYVTLSTNAEKCLGYGGRTV